MSVVRPFPIRLARTDAAARVVTSLAEPPAEADSAQPTPAIEPADYRDAGPALYVYRQHVAGRDHTGVVCEIAIEAFLDGRVRGHERIQERRVDALVQNAAAMARRPGLITLLHHAGPAYARAVEETVLTTPLLDFTGPGGARQRVWRIPDAEAAAADAIAAADLYVADGHHRVAAAIEDWSRRGKPDGAGLLCVVHPMDGLRVSAFHRRVVGPVDRPALLELISYEFVISPVDRRPAPQARSFGLYAGGEWFEVHSPDHPGGWRRLDAKLLESRVLGPLLREGLALGVEIAPARSTLGELTRACDDDEGALFTLAPPALDVLTSRAGAGRMMPAKTTYFEPKPCSGIFVRL